MPTQDPTGNSDHSDAVTLLSLSHYVWGAVFVTLTPLIAMVITKFPDFAPGGDPQAGWLWAAIAFFGLYGVATIAVGRCIQIERGARPVRLMAYLHFLWPPLGPLLGYLTLRLLKLPERGA